MNEALFLGVEPGEGELIKMAIRTPRELVPTYSLWLGDFGIDRILLDPLPSLRGKGGNSELLEDVTHGLD